MLVFPLFPSVFIIARDLLADPVGTFLCLLVCRPGRFYIISFGILPFGADILRVILFVIVTVTEISLRDRNFASRTVSELDSTIATCRIGTHQLFTVLHFFRNDKVCSLPNESRNMKTVRQGLFPSPFFNHHVSDPKENIIVHKGEREREREKKNLP